MMFINSEKNMKKGAALLILMSSGVTYATSIDRQKVIEQFNPVRHASSNATPMQVGNGNFAFGVDVTGLQTFKPFATMSSWGWHNFSLPMAPGQTAISDFTGLDWWTHGRLVNYNQPNSAEPLISNWLIQNPQRINLGRVGFWFDDGLNVTEASLAGKTQTLDLYSGTIISHFTVLNTEVEVQTIADSNSDTISIQIDSDLLQSGKFGVFFDYPYPDVNKFDAPFVGVWNKTSLHTTSVQQKKGLAQIKHDIDATTYYTTIKWDGDASMHHPLNSSHRYVLQPMENKGTTLNLLVNFSPTSKSLFPSSDTICQSAKSWWESYWESGAFLDLTPSNNANATELQRRVILSQYILAVNSAGRDPPQESGLVNNGWYGKFHMEMVVWHLGHWARWGKWNLLNRSIPGLYERFLPSSTARAKKQGYEGARWGKMSDPTGRPAPGEINSLLIWQQPHSFYFAEMEYREFPTAKTLKKWDEILTKTAEFMVSYAWWNVTTGVYDLGPPMYPSSENTNPNATINPTFELTYFHFGLRTAHLWKTRQSLPVPSNWTHVLQNLAPLPVVNGTYAVYEGIPKMWVDPTTYYDHPSMSGIYGLLPPPVPLPSSHSTSPPSPYSLNFTIPLSLSTSTKINQIWNFTQLFGWDFPMLAMNSARLGNPQQAVDYLLDPNWNFDDVGMPIGGPRVATPYLPSCGGLLLAVAGMEGGWDSYEGEEGGKGKGKWPEGWKVRSEGFKKAM